jgi:hypothetical protein
MDKSKLKILGNTLFWGSILWLFGYILGIALYPFVPKDRIGWYILPLGVLFTLWVLIKRIKRDKFGCYIGLGVIWIIMAIALDYAFLVKLFNAVDYYKLDVYVYYALTFLLPVAVGLYKFKIKK